VGSRGRAGGRTRNRWHSYTQPPCDIGICTEGPAAPADINADDRVVQYRNLSGTEQELFDQSREEGCLEYWPPEKWATHAEFAVADGQYVRIQPYGGENGRMIYFALGRSRRRQSGLVVAVRWLSGGEIRIFSE
jgi:hypothetical protein